jgi:hypothetical protein
VAHSWGGVSGSFKEKVFVHRWVYVARRRRGICAPRGMYRPEEKAFVRRLKNEATS